MVNKSLIMRKYVVYIEAEGRYYKEYVPAKSEKDAKSYLDGYHIIGVEEVTRDMPISCDKVVDALSVSGFSDMEVDLIVRALRRTGIADVC